MPQKKWKYFSTPYSRAWLEYRKSEDYATSSAALQKAGIKQPYRNNILKSAFAAGWQAKNENDGC